MAWAALRPEEWVQLHPSLFENHMHIIKDFDNFPTNESIMSCKDDTCTHRFQLLNTVLTGMVPGTLGDHIIDVSGL